MQPTPQGARSRTSRDARAQVQEPPTENGTAASGHRICQGAWSLWSFFLGPGVTLIVVATLAPLYLTAFWPPASRVVDFFQEWASCAITGRDCRSTRLIA